MTSTACHNCKRGPGPSCATCRRVDQDDIRIAHTPHSRAELVALTPQEAASATGLPPDVEDTLRQALIGLFDLDPIELLLVQHIVRRHNLSTFGQVMAKVAARICRYRGSEKAQAHAMKEAIARKWAPLRAIVATMADGKPENVGRMDEVQADLFEAAGIPLWDES